MPKTVDNYIIQKELYKDNFQVQYLSCQHKVLKKPFTLKKVQKPLSECHSKQQQNLNIKLTFSLQCIQNQIDIIRQLKSEKIIKCLKILKARNATYAVYDQHPQKNLQRILLTQYLTFEKKQAILNEILSLIKQVQQHNIAIGNIHPRYLYFTSDNKILTSNFYIAQRLNASGEGKVERIFLDANNQYIAPQVLSKGQLTKAADVYSVGMIIKNLRLENDDLLSPVQCKAEQWKQLATRMIDRNPLKRPSINEVEKTFSLNRSRNKSTAGSNTSKDTDEKQFEVRGLQSYRSEATLKYIGNPKIQASTLLESRSRKTLLDRKQTFQILPHTVKKITLKSKMSYEPLSTSKQLSNLQVPIMRKSRGEQSAKSGSSSNNIQNSLNKTSVKQKMNQIMLLRNIVSFIIQMAHFTSQQNFSTAKDLSYLLIQQGLKYTGSVLKIMDYLLKNENKSNKNLELFYQDCKKEKQWLQAISKNIKLSTQIKGNYQIFLIEQIRKFGKNMLTLYSSNFSLQSQTSRASDSLRRSKQINDTTQYKQIEQKLFKTLLILKKLQFGSFYDFFKAKIHHPNKKFWNQHYFEFQKTFGGKYFIIQIKDLISKK